jgi:hypothetical protein
MENLPLYVGDDVAGVLLEPVPVQMLGHRAELHKEIARQIFWADLAPLFPPKAVQRRLVVSHDDPRVRAAYKGTPLSVILHEISFVI